MAKLEQDFTTGNIGKLLIRFSIPFLLSSLVQSFYSVADMLIVGIFNDAASLSGVNIGGQVTTIVMNIILGLAQGGTVLIAQYYGAKRMEDVKSTISTTLTFLCLLSLAMTAVMLLCSDWMLRIIQTPAESFSEAKKYLVICLYGNIFIFAYNAISAILRGLGDSTRPLMFVIVACVSNVFLDLLFVGSFGMGAAGAAWATVLAQGVSVLISAVYLSRQKFIFDFKLRSFQIDWKKAKDIVRIGIPTSAQNVLVSISFLLMTTLVNGFGVYASAAVGVAGKFNGFAILPASAMSASVSAFAAQNVGAGLYERAKKSLYYGCGIAFGFGLPIFILTQLFPAHIIGIFSDEAEVIEVGIQYLRAFSYDYLAVPAAFCLTGLIVGAGHTTFSMISSMSSSILLRMPMAWILSRTALGLAGIGLAAPLASVGGILISGWFFMTGRWLKDATGIHS